MPPGPEQARRGRKRAPRTRQRGQRHPACDDKHVIPPRDENGRRAGLRNPIAPGSGCVTGRLARADDSSVSFYRQATRAVITGKPNRQPFPDLRERTEERNLAGRKTPTRQRATTDSREFDPDVVPLDLHGKTRLLDPRIEGVSSGRHVELPSVPGAGHDAARESPSPNGPPACGQIPSRAIEVAVDIEERDDPPAGRQFAQLFRAATSPSDATLCHSAMSEPVRWPLKAVFDLVLPRHIRAASFRRRLRHVRRSAARFRRPVRAAAACSSLRGARSSSGDGPRNIAPGARRIAFSSAVGEPLRDLADRVRPRVLLACR